MLLRTIQDLPLSDISIEALKQVPVRRWSGPGGWLLVATGAVAMLYWNGRLVLATGMGVGVMLLVYLMQDWKTDLPWAEIRRFLERWNQPLLLSVGAGAFATLSTYMAASIWMDAESPWIATGGILQGLGTLVVLFLLIGQRLERQVSRPTAQLDQALSELSHDDPLRRLIAVRQLIHTVPDLKQNRNQQWEIADCFRLMLSREQEPIVREALMEGLQTLDRVQALKPTSRPTVDPTAMKRRSARSRQRMPMR
jgi:hypothetical protein